MDIAAELQTALESLTTQLVEMTSQPKPTYSLDGQSVSWTEYLRMLMDGIKATAELLGTFDPVETRSIII